jgi:hypothetical protein
MQGGFLFMDGSEAARAWRGTIRRGRRSKDSPKKIKAWKNLLTRERNENKVET